MHIFKTQNANSSLLVFENTRQWYQKWIKDVGNCAFNAVMKFSGFMHTQQHLQTTDKISNTPALFCFLWVITDRHLRLNKRTHHYCTCFFISSCFSYSGAGLPLDGLNIIMSLLSHSCKNITPHMNFIFFSHAC